jgi:ATP adenylyltransferase
MNNLFAAKLNYVKGKRPKVRCILCSIGKRSPKVKNLVVYETEGFTIALNLYPYNVGHLMIFPKRHVIDVRTLKKEEVLEIHRLAKMSLDILDELYKPSGYNLGYNIGSFSGASIEHIHLHIVPRYRNELGFIDIIGGSKIIVEEPSLTKEKLWEAFERRSCEGS